MKRHTTTYLTCYTVRNLPVLGRVPLLNRLPLGTGVRLHAGMDQLGKSWRPTLFGARRWAAIRALRSYNGKRVGAGRVAVILLRVGLLLLVATIAAQVTGTEQAIEDGLRDIGWMVMGLAAAIAGEERLGRCA